MSAYQQTSLEAYIEATKQPELGRKQQIVFDVIRSREGISNNEIAKILGWPINTVTPRTKELRSKGFVVGQYTRLCSVTGRRVIPWRAKV